MKHKLIFLYPLITFFYTFYSYTQVAPNLVLSSNPYYWSFQQLMWQIGYHQRPLSTLLYVVMTMGMFACYLYLLRQVKRNQLSLKQVLLLFGTIVIVLLPSYPALSNDVFNYLMNAKMMVIYHASPYTHAAWDFPGDLWLNFLMNIHTTTPYGYVWTGIGYLVYLAGFGRLQFGMLGFRMLGLASVMIISYSIWILAGKKRRLEAVTWFLCNPLVILEAINNAHNDITMMAFFVGGLAFLKYFWKSKPLVGLFGFILAWILSVQTKLITIIFPAVVLWSHLLKTKLPQFNWADYLAVLFVLAQFGDTAHRFFPWYLLWAMAIAPLAKSRFVRQLLLLFSFTAMISYVFYLYTGVYSDILGRMRIVFFFSLPVIYVVKRGVCRLL